MNNATEAMDFGFGGIWGIIMLLIIAGLFSNGGFGFGGNNATRDITNEFLFNNLSNDVRANGLAINTTDRDVLENRYQNALQTNTLQNQASINALEMQSKLDSCCCTIQNAIHSDGEATRALITQNRIADLEKELNLAQIVASNSTQTQNILNSLGNYYPRVGVNPYSVYGSCGCNNSII